MASVDGLDTWSGLGEGGGCNGGEISLDDGQGGDDIGRGFDNGESIASVAVDQVDGQVHLFRSLVTQSPSANTSKNEMLNEICVHLFGDELRPEANGVGLVVYPTGRVTFDVKQTNFISAKNYIQLNFKTEI